MRRLAALLLIWLALPAIAQDGAAVYHQAEGLVAHLGRPDGPVLPKGTLTCAGCHGSDGGGGSEGGLSPAPPINWTALASATADRPAYDDAALTRLLREGITPAGQEISARMPRFQGDPAVMAALADYLRSLDMAEQQGLAADSIAVTLPMDPQLHAGALAAIEAFNAEGGAFGRRIVVAEPGFLDLGAALDQVMPRLARAEEARLSALLRADPGLQPASRLHDGLAGPIRVAGTLDQIGPHLSRLQAQEGAETVVIGPDAEALHWAVANRQTGAAAHAYAASRAALNLLREYGRQPTRTRLIEDLDQIETDELIAVYRDSAGAE